MEAAYAEETDLVRGDVGRVSGCDDGAIIADDKLGHVRSFLPYTRGPPPPSRCLLCITLVVRGTTAALFNNRRRDGNLIMQSVRSILASISPLFGHL